MKLMRIPGCLIIVPEDPADGGPAGGHRTRQIIGFGRLDPRKARAPRGSGPQTVLFAEYDGRPPGPRPPDIPERLLTNPEYYFGRLSMDQVDVWLPALHTLLFASELSERGKKNA